MHAIKMKKYVDSDVLHLQVPSDMIGKEVEIIILVEPGEMQARPSRTESSTGSPEEEKERNESDHPPDDDLLIEFYR